MKTLTALVASAPMLMAACSTPDAPAAPGKPVTIVAAAAAEEEETREVVEISPTPEADEAESTSGVDSPPVIVDLRVSFDPPAQPSRVDIRAVVQDPDGDLKVVRARFWDDTGAPRGSLVLLRLDGDEYGVVVPVAEGSPAGEWSYVLLAADASGERSFSEPRTLRLR